MKYLYHISFIIIILLGCQPIQRNTKQVSTIDSTMQINVASILESKLSKINAQSGQVIIMDVQTGQIKTRVGLTRKDSANYQLLTRWDYDGLMAGDTFRKTVDYIFERK